MKHFPNHYEKVKELLDQFGLEGYGAYWIVNELISSSPSKSMSKPELSKRVKGIIPSNLFESLINDKNHFYELNGNYYTELERTHDLTVEGAYRSLDKRGLFGRGFSKILQIYSTPESKMMEQFNKWMEFNKGVIFKDDRHIFNSFNYWMSKLPKEKKEVVSDNWEGIS